MTFFSWPECKAILQPHLSLKVASVCNSIRTTLGLVALFPTAFNKQLELEGPNVWILFVSGLSRCLAQ